MRLTSKTDLISQWIFKVLNYFWCVIASNISYSQLKLLIEAHWWEFRVFILKNENKNFHLEITLNYIVTCAIYQRWLKIRKCLPEFLNRTALKFYNQRVAFRLKSHKNWKGLWIRRVVREVSWPSTCCLLKTCRFFKNPGHATVSDVKKFILNGTILWSRFYFRNWTKYNKIKSY
jgi:hypothetical protein